MPGTEEQEAIGRRMRAAALQAGFSAYEIAEHLGVRPATIYRWWGGQRTASPTLLQAYAERVQKPVAFFYGSEAPLPEEPRELLDLLLGWADLLMAGEKPRAAFDRVVGERQRLTRRERQRLAAVAPQMREELTAAAGGDWALLSEAERRQILEQIAQLAQRRRSAPPEPPS